MCSLNEAYTTVYRSIMATTKVVPSSTRLIQTTKVLSTTISLSKEPIVVTTVYTSVQSSVSFPADTQTVNKTFLGDPSVEGAYEWIAGILIYNVVFLVCCIIFAVCVCRRVNEKKRSLNTGHAQTDGWFGVSDHNLASLSKVYSPRNDEEESTDRSLYVDRTPGVSRHKSSESGIHLIPGKKSR